MTGILASCVVGPAGREVLLLSYCIYICSFMYHPSIGNYYSPIFAKFVVVEHGEVEAVVGLLIQLSVYPK